MVGQKRSRARTAPALAAVIGVVAFGSSTVGLGGTAAADVVTVTGSAYGYFTNVSLFGGPSSTHGPAPRVTLPAGGSVGPLTSTLPDGAKGQYGPAVVFGGIWPDEAPTGGPSGPITVSTEGTLGPNGSVTSSVGIVMHNPPRPLAPGGIGPGPLIAQEAHSTCKATESGVTGSARFVNGIVETKYDSETQYPIQSAIRQIPVNPPPNQEYTGTLDHVGDHFRIVLNEQIRNADGSLTVNAAHMFLLGPIAIGEMIIGQSICGLTAGPSSQVTPTPTSPSPSPTSPSPTSATPSPGSPSPTTTVAGVSPSSTVAPESVPSTDPSPSTTSALQSSGSAPGRLSDQGGSGLAASPVSDSNSNTLGILIPILALIAGGVGAVIWTRRRRLGKGDELPSGPA